MPHIEKEMTADEFDALLAKYNVTWDDFEANQWGEISVEGITYRMRVGLHMNRPMQVIMANDKFVRIRDAEKYAHLKLEKLDPANATAALYPIVTTQPKNIGVRDFAKKWLPEGWLV